MKENVLTVQLKTRSNPACFPTLLSLRKLFTLSFLFLLFLSANDVKAQQWRIIANEQKVTSVSSNYTNIALVSDGANSIPYVVYTESGVAKVKKLQADSSWAQVGGNLTTGSATFTRIYADQTGKLYVTYVDGTSGNKLAVKTYNDTSNVWEPLAGNSSNLYVSSGTVTYTISQYTSTPRSSLAFDVNNLPYIAYGEGSSLTPYVKRFNGTSWETVGSGAVAAKTITSPSLVLDETDTPWLVFVSQSSNTATAGTMNLFRFNGSTWTEIAVPAQVNGAASGGTTSIRHTSMAMNAAGNLHIGYFNISNSNRATVAAYNKTAGTWSLSGTLSGRDATFIQLTRDISGNLYASFVDAFSSTYRGVGRVFKQYAGGTSWIELRESTASAGVDEPVGNLHTTVGSDTSKPFIVYTKTNSASVTTPVVRMFIPPPPPAVLSTGLVTNYTTTSAVASGNITSDGGSTVTQRGIVYGTTSNPTTAGTKVVDASGGTGSFTVNLTGLTPGTYYFVRAYAVNASGTTYGNQETFSTVASPDPVVNAPKQMEYLNRGLVAVRSNTSTVYVGWRLLGTDPSGIAFNVYRDGVKLNATPITNSTNYADNTSANGTYTVRPVLNGVEGGSTPPVSVWAKNQLTIPLQIPAGGTTPDGVAYTYTANDASVGDVDGDGEYEVFLKWDPTKLNHNSGGYSGDQIIDCYKMNGTRLWRINLGKNLNAGPHFTQFMVYDLDGDGKAEIAMKTADGTVDGQGAVIGNPLVDYRNSNGWVDQGPEYLTVFNGLTGAAMATVNYGIPRGSYSDWGDSYGNRAERYVNAIAYLDGVRPSLIIGRGYYEKLARAAYDWRNGQLTLRWVFNSEDPAKPANIVYSSQGNHQMSIADVDGDGKDEVINGSSVINDDGNGLWSNRKGHGDALHVTDMDPDRPGLEEWINLESPSEYNGLGLRLNDAKTGNTIWGVPTTGDVGRSMAADIDPAHKGYEVWGSSGNLYNIKGQQISTNKPTYNFGIWWDGNLARELLDGTKIDRWNPATQSLNRVFTVYLAAPISSNNDTKANPSLQADLFGDWREEVIYRYSDNTNLVIFTTTAVTDQRIYTLMHDPQYRTAIAWQNSGYNQPPYPSFYLGYDMAAPPMPNIAVNDITAPAVSIINRQVPDSAQTDADSVTFRVFFTEEVTGVDAGDFALALTGDVNAIIGSVTSVSPAVYDIRVDNITGAGTLRLDLDSSGTNITDTAGNSIAGGFTTGQVYTIVKKNQTITFPALGTKSINDADFDPGATASSGLPVSYTSSNTAVATIVNGMIHIVGIGTTEVTASQEGNNKYNAAVPVSRTLTVKQVFYQDYDRDTYGNAASMIADTVSPGAGWVTRSGDCNDKYSTVHPGATEICDNLDNDCDGQVDEGQSQTTYYQDYDRDTYGNPNSVLMDCSGSAPVGYVTRAGDCNDKYSDVYPGATEKPDNLDNNCDGTIDEGVTLITFYQDYDRDGYGNPNAVIMRSKYPGPGWVVVSGDCNDKKSWINPGATEVANGVDDDCDGQVDEGARPVVSVPSEAVEEAMTSARIKVTAAPNPSNSRFTLSIRSKNSQPVQLRVLNILGSLVEQRLNVVPNSTLHLGRHYKAGTYFVEVRQGEDRQVLKLVKQQ